MGDYLVELGSKPGMRKWIKKLGLPVPIPQRLLRAEGPWEERPLDDLSVVVAHGPQARLSGVLARTLARAGANPAVLAQPDALEGYHREGEAFARRPVALSPGEPGPAAHALIYDGTGLSCPEELADLYRFFHERVAGIRHCGRAIVLARPPLALRDPAAAAAARALEGFVRSLGREIGKRGATSQMVYVDEGAEERLPPVLRFLLSRRSAFVSGQVLGVSARVAQTGEDSEPPRVRPLERKVALLTGAAQGIGAATARALAREGAQVICLDRPEAADLTNRLAEEIGGTPLLLDITQPDAGERIAALVGERFPGLDVIVHNAGITRDKTLAKMGPELWDQTLEVNLIAVIRVTRALLSHLGRDARLVFLSSIAGIAGNVGQTNYAASKAGVIGYVQALAAQLAERGIAVNAVAPGLIETRLTAAMPAVTREVARRLSNLAQGGLPEDVAEVVTFLASPGAAGLSGMALRICGGSFVGA